MKTGHHYKEIDGEMVCFHYSYEQNTGIDKERFGEFDITIEDITTAKGSIHLSALDQETAIEEITNQLRNEYLDYKYNYQ